MTLDEKRAWGRLAAAVAAYAVYVAVLLAAADGRPLAGVPYEGALLGCVAATIALIAAAEVLARVTAAGSRGRDARDREIWLRGEHAGHAVAAFGSLAALLMAAAHWDTFWIANVIYLAAAASTALAQLAKVAMYRGTIPPW